MRQVFFAAVVLLAACGSDRSSNPRAVETEVPEELQAQPASSVADPGATDAQAIGTPMAERVATLGLLNKRNNLTQDIELKPGEARRIGDVVVILAACERTAPWEMPQETGAFVQVQVRNKQSDEWKRIFSGWLFRNSPSINVVEHPIYDVWVKDCAMRFPGEEDTASAAGSEPAGPTPSSSPAPASEMSPAQTDE